MANRHLSRSIVLQTLFEWDFKGHPTEGVDEMLERKPHLHTAVRLRRPFVDMLSHLQLRGLSEAEVRDYVARTAGIDRGIFDNPILCGTDSKLYKHEYGVDAAGERQSEVPARVLAVADRQLLADPLD